MLDKMNNILTRHRLLCGGGGGGGGGGGTTTTTSGGGGGCGGSGTQQQTQPTVLGSMVGSGTDNQAGQFDTVVIGGYNYDTKRGGEVTNQAITDANHAGNNIQVVSESGKHYGDYTYSNGTLTVYVDPPSSGSGGSYSGGYGGYYVPPSPPPPPPPTTPRSFTRQLQTTVSKYEYIYGAKSISVSGKNTAKSSAYVSKPVDVDGCVVQVSLTSEENHPAVNIPYTDGETSDRSTSIEYYVSCFDDPTPEQWISIIPDGMTQIKNELLFFENGKAKLRFKARIDDPNISVYEDGIKILHDGVNNAWSLVNDGSEVVIHQSDYYKFNPEADYTIDYKPNMIETNPYIVNFVDNGAEPKRFIGNDLLEGEVFDGTNHNCAVKLSFTPYIDYNVVNNAADYNPNTSSYKPILVSMEQANIAIPNRLTTTTVLPYSGSVDTPHTKNMTDYVYKTTPVLNAYDLTINTSTNKPNNLGFEYYQDGSTLYFTETFNNSENIANMDINHGNAKIRVVYEYLSSSIRVKIVLRRTGKSEYSSISPTVSRYTLSMLTLK